MDNQTLYIAPSNVPSRNGLITRHEAIALNVFCQMHDTVHVAWGHTTVCSDCKASVFLKKIDQWNEYNLWFEKLLREFCSPWINELLDGHCNDESKRLWLVDILTTICVVHKKNPAEVLGSFADYTDFMEKAFSGPL